MLRKAVPVVHTIENIFAVVLMTLLTVLPLLLKIVQEYISIPVVDSDIALVNLVFLFTCVAGVITWRADKHLGLASLSDNAPDVVKKVLTVIRTGTVSAVLTALFFSAYSQAFTMFMPGDRVWGISKTLIYAFLPAAYLIMLIMVCLQKKNRISAIFGLIVGLVIAAGPLSGVLYYTFHTEHLGLLYAINDWWLSFSSVAVIPLVILMLVLAFLGVPLFIAIAGIAYIAFSQGGGYVEVVAIESYGIWTDKSIAAIPLFTTAGYLLSQGTAGQRLVGIFRSLFGWFRGGTVVAAVVVTTFFTTFTGVSGVTILALGSLLTIVLTGSGYGKENAESLITASGALGLLFPPSVAIIMYGTTNYFSVDVFDLFRAAVIPGAILALSMIVLGIIMDKNSTRPPFSFKDIRSSLAAGWLEILMPVLICITYFTGIFSLLECASFAVLYAFVLETFIRKDFSLRRVLSVIVESIPVSGGVLFIMGAAKGLSAFLVDAYIPQLLAEYVSTVVTSKYVFLLLLNIALLVVGCLMDIYSAILIVSPLIIPIAESFGLSAVHTGVIFLMNMQLGFLTPPVGMDLFIASYTFERPVIKIVKGIFPFLVVQFFILMCVTYIPWFTEIL